jgi:hypothetical protein
MPTEKGTRYRTGLDLARLLLLYKAICFLLIGLAIALLPPIFSVANYKGNVHLPEMISSNARFFQTWDTQQYLIISHYGYRAGSGANGMYPLWPFCIRLFSRVTGWNHLLSGLILANFFSLIALVMLHRYIARSSGAALADRTIMLMLAFPGALFLLFPYSEPLFLLLCVAIFISLSLNDYLKAGLASLLAALARPVGVLWVIPFAVHIFRNRKMSAIIYLFLPLLGYGCYLAIMYLSTGNAIAGFIEQSSSVSHNTMGKLFDPIGFIKTLTMPLNVHGFVNSAIDRTWFCFFVLSLFPLWKKDKVMFSYALVMGLVPAVTVSTMSFTRYSVMLIPSFIVAADFFTPAARRGLFLLTLAGLFGMQIIFLIRHINFYWAG